MDAVLIMRIAAMAAGVLLLIVAVAGAVWRRGELSDAGGCALFLAALTGFLLTGGATYGVLWFG